MEQAFIRSTAHLLVVSQSTHHFLDLLGQLTGGSQHQGLAFHEVVVQVLQDARAEGGSLASPRLGLLDHVQIPCQKARCPSAEWQTASQILQSTLARVTRQGKPSTAF